MLDFLQNPSLVPSHTKAFKTITLPSTTILDDILGKNASHFAKGISYNISDSTHALSQATSLTNVLGYPLLSQDSTFRYLLSWSENKFWLLDVLLDLRHVQKRWELSCNTRPMALIGKVLEIAHGTLRSDEADKALRNKAFTLLVLLCGDMVTSPGELILDDDAGLHARVTYCKALAAIAKASLWHRAIGRLAESKLVNELVLLSSQYAAIGEGTDVWVSLDGDGHVSVLD